MTPELARAIASRRAVAEPPAVDDGPPDAIAAPSGSRDAVSAADPSPAAGIAVAGTGGATARARPGRPARTGSAEPRPAAAGRKARRRFSLPPLDDDHEKVSRSIETFLGGSDATTDAAGDGGTAAGATTVAVVAIDGLPATRRRSRSAKAATEDDPVTSALAMVERTIRGTARGSDVVSVADRGRFRIVLPATGELAARAYLRRIRAIVEPLLESADRPLRLAVATATVLDEPVADAVRRADRRLTAALDAMRMPDASAPASAGRSVGGTGAAGDPGADGDDADELDAEPRAAGD